MNEKPSKEDGSPKVEGARPANRRAPGSSPPPTDDHPRHRDGSRTQSCWEDESKKD